MTQGILECQRLKHVVQFIMHTHTQTDRHVYDYISYIYTFDIYIYKCMIYIHTRIHKDWWYLQIAVFTLHASDMNLRVADRHDLHALLLSVPSFFGLNPTMKEFLRFRNKNIGKMALDCDGSGALTLVMKALYQLTAEQLYTFVVEST